MPLPPMPGKQNETAASPPSLLSGFSRLSAQQDLLVGCPVKVPC